VCIPCLLNRYYTGLRKSSQSHCFNPAVQTLFYILVVIDSCGILYVILRCGYLLLSLFWNTCHHIGYFQKIVMRNQVVNSLLWLWWVIDLVMFEFESGTVSFFFFYLCFIWWIVFACLVVCRWQVRHGMQRREPWQEYETWCRGSGMVTQVGYSVSGRSRGRVVPCAVCTCHAETKSASFLVEP
jgi:hypothetical protein